MEGRKEIKEGKMKKGRRRRRRRRRRKETAWVLRLVGPCQWLGAVRYYCTTFVLVPVCVAVLVLVIAVSLPLVFLPEVCLLVAIFLDMARRGRFSFLPLKMSFTIYHVNISE